MTAETSPMILAAFMLVFGVGLGFINSVMVTVVQNAIPRAQMGVGTAGTTLFRQVGGSLGVAVFGAIFSARLAIEMATALPGSASHDGFSRELIATLPPETRDLALAAFANALHPAFLVGASLAAVAFVVAWFIPELPLANTLREEAATELKAEEDTVAAAAGAPASAAA
jgi:hypothetical protein